MKIPRLPSIDRSPQSGPVWCSNKWVDFPSTEYISQYELPILSHLKGFSPSLSYEITPSVFNDTSEYRDSYLLSSRNRKNNFIRRLDQIQIPKTPMESITNYNNEFIKKETEKSIPMQHPLSQLDYLFQGNKKNKILSSVYQGDFQKEENNKKCKSLTKGQAKIINNQGAPTDYQKNFDLKKPTRVYMPYPTYKKDNVAFSTDTDYNSTFVKHPFCQSQMINPLKPNISVEKTPFSKQSLYRYDFNNKETKRELSISNFYQNPSSVMLSVPMGKWYESYPSQKFQDYSDHVFYRK